MYTNFNHKNFFIPSYFLKYNSTMHVCMYVHMSYVMYVATYPHTYIHTYIHYNVRR